MKKSTIICQNCGYIPPTHEQPRSGTWFCPKCGKRVSISRPITLPRQTSSKRGRTAKHSRDQITNQIYSNITKNTQPNLGLKENYLNPKIDPILPKKRRRIQIFSKTRKS